MLLSELSALEYFIVKHVAALMLASDTSPFKDVAPLDDLLDIIDARKNTFWGKLFKGGNNEKKNVKKKGECSSGYVVWRVLTSALMLQVCLESRWTSWSRGTEQTRCMELDPAHFEYQVSSTMSCQL